MEKGYQTDLVEKIEKNVQKKYICLFKIWISPA